MSPSLSMGNFWSFFDIIHLNGFGIIGKSIFYRTLRKSILIPTLIMSSAILVQSIPACTTPRRIQMFDAHFFTLVHEPERLMFSRVE